jgi:hypothetical protein
MIIDIEREKRTSFISSEWRSSEFGVALKKQILTQRTQRKEKEKLNHGNTRKITEVKAKDRHEFHKKNKFTAKALRTPVK